MDGDGTRDARGTHANPVPRPAGPPQVPAKPAEAPAVPPRPTRAPGTTDGSAFLTWLRTPRPQALPGVWRFGHRPRPEEEPERVPGRQLLSGAVIAFLVGWLVWSLLWNGYLGGWWLLPLYAMIPDSWAEPHSFASVVVVYAYYVLIAGIIMVAVGRLGRWGEIWRRYGPPAWRRAAAPGGGPPPAPEEDPAAWPALRAAGAHDAAERLAAEARSGLMRDVDHARIARAWQGVQRGRHSLATFTGAVLREGAGACPHPSGARDLPVRQARHDLVTGQVRIGTAADDARNPYAYRGAGLALGPDLLGTSLLAVGPAGSGKTGSVVRPLSESLCLQALAGRAAVVVVGAAGADLGPADAYDVVVRIGNPDSVYDLDLYGGTTDPDEAAVVLAEALVGDLAEQHQGGDSRRSTTVLAQLLGPFRAVHGRFPGVPELRQLLEGAPGPLAELREGLSAGGHDSLLRELDARERQLDRPGDVGGVLADRVALLDRPAFAPFFDTSGQSRPFSLKALDHPVRVRIDLPQRGHADASRMLARLVLAQFTASVSVREDRSLFACLVLDDASGVVTPEAVRGVQRLRSAGAGVVLTLRTLDDVPRPLRGPLLGAIGCRMALSGLTPWDGQDFAEVWGKEWTEARDVTDRQIIAETPAGKAVHMLRRVITGKAPTARAVTVRQVERERWSASELAHAVPAGHAVLSLTSVKGEHAPPLLVDLRG
ncbi:ATP-binding protein [Streptomyces sp. enrichment culture]|uniref:ATP-binding protein n=1 Tax=Streptomyces sp. enrichment culture TaxID=1795815 RepID=UPI003F56CD94